MAVGNHCPLPSPGVVEEGVPGYTAWLNGGVA